jgi:hypothetical protein
VRLQAAFILGALGIVSLAEGYDIFQEDGEALDWDQRSIWIYRNDDLTSTPLIIGDHRMDDSSGGVGEGQRQVESRKRKPEEPPREVGDGRDDATTVRGEEEAFQKKGSSGGKKERGRR